MLLKGSALLDICENKIAGFWTELVNTSTDHSGEGRCHQQLAANKGAGSGPAGGRPADQSGGGLIKGVCKVVTYLTQIFVCFLSHVMYMTVSIHVVLVRRRPAGVNAKHTSAAALTFNIGLSQIVFQLGNITSHANRVRSSALDTDTKEYKERRDGEGKQTQTPVECLSSLTGALALLAPAAGRGECLTVRAGRRPAAPPWSL